MIKNWYYVGSTNSLERRLKEHNGGKVKSTKSYTPFIIAFTKEFNNEKDARSYEKTLKINRREKERIIRSLQ